MSGGRLTRPPFIDPTTGIAYDCSNSEFEGHLTKQSMWLRVSEKFHYVQVHVRVICVVLSTVYHFNSIHVICIVGFFCLYIYSLGYTISNLFVYVSTIIPLMRCRIGVEDFLYWKDQDYSLQKLHMRHPTVWLTWVDVQLWSRLIWNHIKNIALRLVHQKLHIFCMQVRYIICFWE